MAVRELALANVLSELLPALDANRAGPAARRAVRRLQVGRRVAGVRGVQARPGDVRRGGRALRPDRPRGATHSYSPDVSEVTCVEIYQPGYKVGDRILRPARVAVAEPDTGPDGAPEPGASGAGQPDQPAGRTATSAARSDEHSR